MRFFLIDRIVAWEIGGVARATKNIALSEDFFDDHFPRRPIMPGVLILEGMAQLAGVFLEETVRGETGLERKAVMSLVDRTKFLAIVKPGDQLEYEARVLASNELGGRVAVRARRGGEEIVATTLTFVLQEMDDPFLARDRRRLLELWRGGGEGADDGA